VSGGGGSRRLPPPPLTQNRLRTAAGSEESNGRKTGMTKQAKIIVTAALMLGMYLAALDTTIVGTALPSIVGKLGGISLYSWVFSVYLMTSSNAVPIYGKLADLYGRKPLFLLGKAKS